MNIMAGEQAEGVVVHIEKRDAVKSLLVYVALMLAGQSACRVDREPVFAAYDDSMLAESYVVLLSNLIEEDRCLLEETIGSVATLYPSGDIVAQPEVRKWLHGKTAREVMAKRGELDSIYVALEILELANLERRSYLYSMWWENRGDYVCSYKLEEIKDTYWGGDDDVYVNITMRNNGDVSIAAVTGKLSVSGVKNSGKSVCAYRDKYHSTTFSPELCPGEKRTWRTRVNISPYYTRRYDFVSGGARFNILSVGDEMGRDILNGWTGLNSYDAERLDELCGKYSDYADSLRAQY